MGMFDTVKIDCPRCGEYFEKQSKWGPCELKEFYVDNAPLSILDHLTQMDLRCPICDTPIKIHVQKMVTIRVDKNREEED